MKTRQPGGFLKPVTQAAMLLFAVVSAVAGAATADALNADMTGNGQGARKAGGVLLPKRLSNGSIVKPKAGRVDTQLSSLRVNVKSFRIENSPFVSAEELDRLLAPHRNRDLSFEEFEYVVHLVADYLRGNGHPRAEVSLTRAGLAAGVVAIALNGLSPGGEVSPTMTVREFRIEGLTVATEEEMRPLLEPWANREMTVKQMQEVAQTVAGYLRNKGYPLAQAFLPPQRIDTGLIRVQVLEGKVDPQPDGTLIAVESEGRRVNPDVIAKMLDGVAQTGEPLKSKPLERALSLAGDLAGVKSVKAELSPGVEPGSTRVSAKVEETRIVTGSVVADNTGSPFIGENRLSTQINLNSPFGRGEQFSLLTTDSSRLESRKFVAQTPVGYSGLKVGASASALRVDIGANFIGFDLNSKTDINSVFASYPLFRSPQQNLSLALNIDDKHVVNNLQGFRENDRRLDVRTLSLGGDKALASGGQVLWNTSFTQGDVNLDGNLAFKQRDAGTAMTQGNFRKLNGTFATLLPLGQDSGWSLYGTVTGQKAAKNLDSVEKFQLGGPAGVRAYPSGEGLGDSGILASAELRKSLARFETLGDLNGFLFVDAGTVRQNEERFLNDVVNRPNEYTLKGMGLGASLSKSELGVVRVVFARKIGSNPNPSVTGTDVDGRSSSSRVLIYLNAQF